MIAFEHVSVQYARAGTPTLRDVTFEIDEGAFALVAGRTGVGKSTLLGAVNGHVPHFTGGTLAGRVSVDGLDTRDHPPRELAHVVGVVGQDPLLGFVTDTVEEELAYGMEQLGVAPATMRRRVEDAMDLLSIADLRARPLRALSGGQQQRVAIASVLAAGARVLVLDEPTSALDPTSAEEVLAALLRLVHDVGVTLLIAEHRLERVLEYADVMLLLTGDGGVRLDDPATIMRDSPIAPPVVELGRLAGWSPLPLSVRDARRDARSLRERLSVVAPDRMPRLGGGQVGLSEQDKNPSEGLQARGITVAYGDLAAVQGADLDLSPGAVTALMGRNGSGKSSLLWALTGVGPCQSGTWSVDGVPLRRAGVDAIRRHLRLVPQTASDLLYLDSAGAECAQADAQNARPSGTCRAMLDELTPDVADSSHPRDLSQGQQLALALAVQLCGQPSVLLLDEPTRGLDYPAKAALTRMLRRLAGEGRAVGVVTHDVEFAAQVADRAVVMATGEVIQAGPAADVLAASATFAPQVAKVMSPQRWLTVAQVAAGLGASAGASDSSPAEGSETSAAAARASEVSDV